MTTNRVRIDGSPVDVDASMVALVKALNRIPGLDTYSSCEGHKNPTKGQSPWGRWCVSINVNENSAGWRAIERVASVAGDLNCRLVAWSDGGVLSFGLEGATVHCTPDRFAEGLASAR